MSGDIVNIFKERKDIVIYPSDMYPPFVMKLLEEKYTADDVMMQMYRGERIPSGEEQWTLAKSFRRTQLKDRNVLVKQRWEYESEDDVGEDLGGVAGAKIEEEAMGELEDSEGGEGAASEGKKAAAEKD